MIYDDDDDVTLYALRRARQSEHYAGPVARVPFWIECLLAFSIILNVCLAILVAWR
ncbi:MAG: hypothetical protein NVS1B14_04080 [Vulcanimicrobiaceae bacterium]